MTRRIAAATAATLLVLAGIAGAAEPDEKARHADIRKLMQLTGAGALGVQFAEAMMQSLRPLIPDAPEAFWKEFEASLDPDEMVEKVIPVYAKHLSAKDVKELITFYESPVGRKLARVQPAILQDSMAVGQAWGREIAERVVRSARERGFEVKNL